MSYVKEMFGKKYKELTRKEKTMYLNAIKGLDLQSKSLCRQKYGKMCKELSRQEKTDCYYQKGDKYKETDAYKMFNKRDKDLTPEERRVFIRTRSWYKNKLKNSYKEGFCFNHFGKRFNELTPEEHKEFNRIMKRESRRRTGRNL